MSDEVAQAVVERIRLCVGYACSPAIRANDVLRSYYTGAAVALSDLLAAFDRPDQANELDRQMQLYQA